MHDLLPRARAIAFLVNPNNPNAEADTAEIEAAAQATGVRVQVLNASNETEFDRVFSTLAKSPAKGVVVSNDAMFTTRRERIVTLATHDAVPAIYAYREYVDAGGLMSYGTSVSDTYRQAGIYTGRILKGEKPANLPVMQPTQFELVINLKTAKALGLDVPATVLARADEVIE